MAGCGGVRRACHGRLVPDPGERPAFCLLGNFVEYQLAAKKLRPDRFRGPGRVWGLRPVVQLGTVVYTEGGYETEPRSNNVAPKRKPC